VDFAGVRGESSRPAKRNGILVVQRRIRRKEGIPDYRSLSFRSQWPPVHFCGGVANRIVPSPPSPEGALPKQVTERRAGLGETEVAPLMPLGAPACLAGDLGCPEAMSSRKRDGSRASSGLPCEKMASPHWRAPPGQCPTEAAPVPCRPGRPLAVRTASCPHTPDTAWSWVETTVVSVTSADVYRAGLRASLRPRRPVRLLLAVHQRQFHFDPAALFVKQSGKSGCSLLAYLGHQGRDIRSRAGAAINLRRRRSRGYRCGERIDTDIQLMQPRLAGLHAGVGVDEGHLARRGST